MGRAKQTTMIRNGRERRVSSGFCETLWHIYYKQKLALNGCRSLVLADIPKAVRFCIAQLQHYPALMNLQLHTSLIHHSYLQLRQRHARC